MSYEQKNVAYLVLILPPKNYFNLRLLNISAILYWKGKVVANISFIVRSLQGSMNIINRYEINITVSNVYMNGATKFTLLELIYARKR